MAGDGAWLPCGLWINTSAYAGLTGRVDVGAMLGLILLVVAAGGGVVMNLGYHIAGKLLPLWLLYLHIALAAAGTLLVAWGAWKI